MLIHQPRDASRRPRGLSIWPSSPAGRLPPPPSRSWISALLEHQAELLQRLAMAAEHEAAGCILVQPMGKRRISRQSEGQLAKELFEVDLARRGLRLSARDARARRPACRAPASARRGRAGGIASPAGGGDRESGRSLPLKASCLPAETVIEEAAETGPPQHASSDDDKKPGLPIPPVRPGAAAPAEGQPAPPAASRSDDPGSEPEAPRISWWRPLRTGLSRSSGAIGTGITDLFTKRKLDGRRWTSSRTR